MGFRITIFNDLNINCTARPLEVEVDRLKTLAVVLILSIGQKKSNYHDLESAIMIPWALNSFRQDCFATVFASPS